MEVGKGNNRSVGESSASALVVTGPGACGVTTCDIAAAPAHFRKGHRIHPDKPSGATAAVTSTGSVRRGGGKEKRQARGWDALGGQQIYFPPFHSEDHMPGGKGLQEPQSNKVCVGRSLAAAQHGKSEPDLARCARLQLCLCKALVRVQTPALAGGHLLPSAIGT